MARGRTEGDAASPLAGGRGHGARTDRSLPSPPGGAPAPVGAPPQSGAPPESGAPGSGHPPAYGRAGRGRWHAGAPEPKLAAAGFLSHLREGGVADAARSELWFGAVVARPPRRSAEASLLAALREGLEDALLTCTAAGSENGPVEGTPYIGRVEVAALPLLRLGPELVLRPELALLARHRRWGPGPAPGELVSAGAGLAAEGVVLVVELGAHGQSEARRPERGGPGQRSASLEGRLSAYAVAGVREVWSLDVDRTWTVAYRSPWGGAYRSRTLWYPGEAVPVTGLNNVAVETFADAAPAGRRAGG